MFFRKSLVVFLFLIISSSSSAGRYDGIIKSIDDFMGNGASVKAHDSKKFVAVGENGNKFRIDFDGHHDKPHLHLEVPNANGGVDNALQGTHRIYLKE